MRLRNLFENIARTGKGNTAVVGWGRGMGHKGHMMLASSVITKAKEAGGDPYFVVSRTVGKDDPITPEEKLAIYKKVFPQQGHIFQAASDEIPDLTRVLSNLNQQGYKNAVVVVGEDQVKAFQYLKNYNGKPDKAGNVAFNFDNLEIISRQETGDPSAGEEGPRATPMRQVLMDPSKSEQEQFAVWRDAMNPELSDQEVMDLMNKAKERMSAFAAPKKKAAVGEEAAGVGVIASKKQAKDPRYSMSLTRDVRPGQVEKNLKAFGLAEGWPSGLGRPSAKPETVAKRSEWQKTPLTSNTIVIDGYTINFTPDALIISKGGKVLWKKEGNYSRPTNSTLVSAKKLVTGLSRQGQPDEKQMFGKVNPDELKSRKEHRKKWQQASNLSHEKKISFQQAWSQLFGDDDVAEGLNEFAPGSGGGESGRWYTDDQMTDIVGDGWWNDLDVSGNISKQEMIREAQAWLDDQGYSVQVLNCRLNDDDMDWFIEGSFHNPGLAKKNEAMLPKSAFAGSNKNKLGPAAHLKGKMKRSARAGDLVGDAEESVQKGIPISEDVERIITPLVDNILAKYIK